MAYVVVGGGPAGLAAASHLAKSGAPVSVYEGRPRPDNVFGSYPVVLNARGFASLEALGVADRAVEMGLPVKQLHVVPNNKTVARVPTWGTGIMRDQVAQLLLEHAEAQPNISFHWQHKLTALDFEARTCSFEHPGGSVTVEAERLVAADGNKSKVRRLCQEQRDFDVQADPWGFQLRFMTSKGKPGQTEVDPATHFVLGDKGYVCQQPNGIWSVSLRVLPSDPEFLTGSFSERNVQQLKEYTELYAKFAADNLLDEEAYKSFYDSPAFDGLVVKCSCLNPAGWICLIGDAAHAVQPATGEGINSGLEDAAILGACVRQNPEDAFSEFDSRQRSNAHALNVLALQARDKVLQPPPRQQATNIMVTIGLGVAKKIGVIQGTNQDFMLGEKARSVGIKSYAELVDMENRQTRVLRPIANFIGKLFRIPKNASRAPEVSLESAPEKNKLPLDTGLHEQAVGS